jgi:hypothetical protein
LHYAYLSHLLASPFTYNIHAFYYFVLVLLALITPMLLFFLSRRWIVVPLYFCCSSYFYFMFMTLSQALAGVLLLLLILARNNYIRLVILLVSIIAHSQAFILLSAAFVILLLFEKSREGILFAPGCSSVFGEARPDEILDTQVAGNPHFGLSIGTILNFLFKVMPFPFLLMGIWQHLKERRFELLAIAAFAIASVPFSSNRTLYVVPLVLLLGMARFYGSGWKKRYKIMFFLMVLGSGVFEFWSWANVKLLCG